MNSGLEHFVEMRIMAMHEDRNRPDLVVQAFDIYGSEEPRPSQRYAYEAVLRLRRGRHRAIVAAYDTLLSPILRINDLRRLSASLSARCWCSLKVPRIRRSFKRSSTTDRAVSSGALGSSNPTRRGG